MPAVMWFRRDLRLSDNPALGAAVRDGPVRAVFVVDPTLWGASGDRRRGYLAASLSSLDRDIREIGGPGLTVLSGRPADVLAQVSGGSSVPVYATADYGPYGVQRDREVALRCDLRTIDSPFLHAPGTVMKPDGSAYRVFTPFYRAWLGRGATPAYPAPEDWPVEGLASRGDGWSLLDAATPPPFPVGEDAALRRWSLFAAERMAEYRNARDYPSRHGTSELSAALKFGEVHPRTLVAAAEALPGGASFVRQLCWRDFYGQVLSASPQSARRNYQPMFDEMRWREVPPADSAFAAWRDGRTGYPFVDAGMRELAATGSMPNRLRMVTASFLVKDLHIDWRRGARHFMRTLYDGDLANNQHGWQWTAGTGTDAAPYYRIFNPVVQGLRFDPDGAYVHRWVPELRALAGAAAHEPWKHPRQLWADYPERILDHDRERATALGMYEAVRAQTGRLTEP